MAAVLGYYNTSNFRIGIFQGIVIFSNHKLLKHMVPSKHNEKENWLYALREMLVEYSWILFNNYKENIVAIINYNQKTRSISFVVNNIFNISVSVLEKGTQKISNIP